MDKSSDLYLLRTNYKNRIKGFLKNKPETRVVFLDGDYGWGKTKFVKDYLEIDDNNRYHSLSF